MMRLSILFLCTFLTACRWPTGSQTPAEEPELISPLVLRSYTLITTSWTAVLDNYKTKMTSSMAPLDENIAQGVRSLRKYLKTTNDEQTGYGMTSTTENVVTIKKYLKSKGFSDLWMYHHETMSKPSTWRYLVKNMSHNLPIVLDYGYYDKAGGETKKDGGGHSAVIYKVHLVKKIVRRLSRVPNSMSIWAGGLTQKQKTQEDHVGSARL